MGMNDIWEVVESFQETTGCMLEETKAHGIIIVAIELIPLKEIPVLDEIEGHSIHHLAIDIGHGLDITGSHIITGNIIKLIVVVDGHLEVERQDHTNIEALANQFLWKGANHIRQAPSLDEGKAFRSHKKDRFLSHNAS